MFYFILNIFSSFPLSSVCIWGWFSWRYFIQTLILAVVITLFLDLGTLWIYYEACYGTDETTFLRLKEPFLQGGRPNIMGFILTMVHRDMIFFPTTSPAFQAFYLICNFKYTIFSLRMQMFDFFNSPVT